MKSADKQFFMILGILIFAMVVSLFLQSKKIKPVVVSIVKELPRIIGNYKSQDLELKERIYEILETRNIIMREYMTENKPPILFYMIYSPQTHKTSDPPENCLRGEGRTITAKKKKVIRINTSKKVFDLNVNLLTVEKGKDKQLYVYWFIAGDTFIDSYFKQRFKLISAYIKRAPLSGGQIRISTPYKNEEEAFLRLEKFIQAASPALLELLS